MKISVIDQIVKFPFFSNETFLKPEVRRGFNLIIARIIQTSKAIILHNTRSFISVCFDSWVLWHINLCRLFKAKSIFM